MKTFTVNEILKELRDCDHLDDAISYFSNHSKSKEQENKEERHYQIPRNCKNLGLSCLDIKMGKDTVILSLKDYNDLRDLKTGIDNGKFFKFQYHINITSWGNGSSSTSYSRQDSFIDKDEAVKEMKGYNDSLSERIEKLNQIINELKNPKEKEKTIKDFENMTIMQFIKYKFKNK